MVRGLGVWGSRDWKQNAWYEHPDKGLWWCTRPKGSLRKIDARAVRPSIGAEFRVFAFPSRPSRLFLYLRFKDGLLSPAPVYAGGTGRENLGERPRVREPLERRRSDEENGTGRVGRSGDGRLGRRKRRGGRLELVGDH